jgi:hypothetical protein
VSGQEVPLMYPDDRLRASHADREQAVETLKTAFVQDRLTRDEFEARLGRALAARTAADLRALTRDLPATARPVTARPDKARPVTQPLARGTIRPGAGVVVGSSAAATAGLWAAGLSSGSVLVLLAAMALSCVFLGLLILVGSVALATRPPTEPPPCATT